MSREIKFRAWDKVNKKWLFGYEYPNLGGFSLVGEVTLMGDLNTVPLERWNDVAIMQYTGLKDKNGVEIYEGDLFQDEEDGFCDYVEWSDFHCGFGTHTWWSPSDLAEHARTGFLLEVIGNIWENPELFQDAE